MFFLVGCQKGDSSVVPARSPPASNYLQRFAFDSFTFYVVDFTIGPIMSIAHVHLSFRLIIVYFYAD